MSKFLRVFICLFSLFFAGAAHAVTCGAGKYVLNNACTDCPNGYYCPGITSTTDYAGRNACTSLGGVFSGKSINGTNNGTIGSQGTRAANTDCFYRTKSGYYVANNTEYLCSTSDYCTGGAMVRYNGEGGYEECPNGYTDSEEEGHSAVSQCQYYVSAGMQIASATAAPSVPNNTTLWPNGWYTDEDHYVNFGSTSGSYVKTCSAGYSTPNSNNSSDHDSASDCKATSVTCAAGYYLAANATSCTKCEVGYYCPGGTYTQSSSIQGRTQCPNTSTSHTSISTYVADTGSSAGASKVAQCIAYGLAFTNINNGSGTRTCYYTSGSGSTATYSTGCHNASYTGCNAGYYITYNGVHNRTPKVGNACTVCPNGTYKPGVNANACTSCITEDEISSGFYIRDTDSSGEYGSDTPRTQIKQCWYKTNPGQIVSDADDDVDGVSFIDDIDVDAAAYSPGGVTVHYGEGYYGESCPSGYEENDWGATSINQCDVWCYAGTQVEKAGATCTTPNNTGYPTGWYTAGHTVYYGNTSATTSSVKSCSAGYSTPNTTNKTDHDNANDCQMASITCDPGYYLKANATSCTSCENGYYCPGGTYTPGSSIQGRTVCSSLGGLYSGKSINGTTNGTIGSDGTRSAPTNCYYRTKPGYEVYPENEETGCEIGEYCTGGVKVYYDDAGGYESCYSLFSGTKKGNVSSDELSTAPNQCYYITAPGEQVDSQGLVETIAPNSGSYSPGSVIVFYGEDYNGSDCPNGYGYNVAEASSINQCRANCAAGTQIKTAETNVATATGNCTTPDNTGYSNGWYAVQHYVNWRSTSGSNVTQCEAGKTTPNTTNKTDHDNANDCQTASITCDPGYYLKANATSCTICPAALYCIGGVYSFSATVAQGITGELAAGYYSYHGATSARPTAVGNGCVADSGNSCGKLATGYYSNKGAIKSAPAGQSDCLGGICGKCPDGYPNSNEGSTVITQCYSGTKSRPWTGQSISPAEKPGCEDVITSQCSLPACSYVAYSNEAGTGDGEIKSGCSTNNSLCINDYICTTCGAGYYKSGALCYACEAGTYQPIKGSTATSCLACDGPLQFQDEEAQASCRLVRPGYYKFSNSAQAQCDEGYRDIAATSRDECVGTFSKLGEEEEPEMPAGWYSRTLFACFPGSCDYTKKYSGAIVNDCIPTNCTKDQFCTAAKAGYFKDGFVCSVCPAGTYQSTDGSTATSCSKITSGHYSTGGGTSLAPTGPGNGCLSEYSCGLIDPGYYSPGGGASPTGSGQVAAGFYSTCGGANAVPYGPGDGCNSKCSCGIVDGGYYSTGGGTLAKPNAPGDGCLASSGNSCGKTTSGYYSDGGAKLSEPASSSDCMTGRCGKCPTGYPNSDMGSIVITKCYSDTKLRAWTGGYNECEKPDNCATVECAECSRPECSYVAYSDAAGTGDGVIKSGCSTNNAKCDQSVGSVTANAGYYVSGKSCVACSGLASGFYPNSDNGNTGGAGACKTDNLIGQYVASENATSATNCGAGNYKASHQVAYGSTSSCDSCPVGLTTIGYGAGADEAADCGYVLHIGGDEGLYLRSVKKTTPSLNVKIGDTVFYGNMSTVTKGKVRIKKDDTTYSVYDDSM